MANYRRNSGDSMYRTVSIQTDMIPPYQNFETSDDVVQYTDMQILEILRENGTEKMIYEKGVEIVNYTVKTVDKLTIPSGIPLARMWVRRSDGIGIPYKVPNGLPAAGSTVDIQISSDAREMEPCGDKYFSMVYKFQRA
jgi:hypothetical protein